LRCENQKWRTLDDFEQSGRIEPHYQKEFMIQLQAVIELPFALLAFWLFPFVSEDNYKYAIKRSDFQSWFGKPSG